MNSGQMTLKTQEVNLRVGGNTNPRALMASIVGFLKAGRTVILDCVGVAANYAATKSIIMARGHMMMVGKTITHVPTFLEVIIDDGEGRQKTAVRWEVKVDGS